MPAEIGDGLAAPVAAVSKGGWREQYSPAGTRGKRAHPLLHHDGGLTGCKNKRMGLLRRPVHDNASQWLDIPYETTYRCRLCEMCVSFSFCLPWAPEVKLVAVA